MKVVKLRRLGKNYRTQVLELAINRLPGGNDHVRDTFTKLFESGIDQEWILAVDSTGFVHGFLNIRTKSFILYGQSFRVLGASFMVTSKTKTNLSIADLLREELFKESISYDLIIGFARKKMDYYWTKFGFLGLGCYPEMKLSLYDIISPSTCNSLTITLFSEKDFDALIQVYDDCSRNNISYFKRDNHDWRLLLNKVLENEHMCLHLLKNGQQIIGYIVHNGNNIIELCINSGYHDSAVMSIKQLFESKGCDTINIKLPSSCRMINRLKANSHTYSVRLAYEGGNIFKVSDPSSVGKKLASIVRERLEKVEKQSGCYVIFDNLATIFYEKDKSCNIQINPEHSFEDLLKQLFISNDVFDSDSIFRLGEVFCPWLDQF